MGQDRDTLLVYAGFLRLERAISEPTIKTSSSL